MTSTIPPSLQNPLIYKYRSLKLKHPSYVISKATFEWTGKNVNTVQIKTEQQNTSFYVNKCFSLDAFSLHQFLCALFLTLSEQYCTRSYCTA